MYTTEYVVQLKREHGWFNSCVETFQTIEEAKYRIKDGLDWDPSREYRIIIREIDIKIKEYIHYDS